MLAGLNVQKDLCGERAKLEVALSMEPREQGGGFLGTDVGVHHGQPGPDGTLGVEGGWPFLLVVSPVSSGKALLVSHGATVFGHAADYT